MFSKKEIDKKKGFRTEIPNPYHDHGRPTKSNLIISRKNCKIKCFHKDLRINRLRFQGKKTAIGEEPLAERKTKSPIGKIKSVKLKNKIHETEKFLANREKKSIKLKNF